jgi:hypothetical protein
MYDTERELDNHPKVRPPYVFFETTAKVYRQEEQGGEEIAGAQRGGHRYHWSVLTYVQCVPLVLSQSSR